MASKEDVTVNYSTRILGRRGWVSLKAARVGILASSWKAIVAVLVAAKKAIAIGFAAALAYLERLFGRKPKREADSSA